MKLTLKRLNDAVLFEGENAGGNSIIIDGSPDIGGVRKGVRPTEALLFSLASCSSIDVVLILKKMRQRLDDIQVEIDAQRAEDRVPKVFTKIHLTFHLKGEMKLDKVEQALQMSVEKYCTVAKMIDKVAEITYSYTIGE